MTTCTVSIAMERIKSARPKSPIAVFRCGEPSQVETVFGDSIMTRRRAEYDPAFVGMFDNTMNFKLVEKALKDAARGDGL